MNIKAIEAAQLTGGKIFGDEQTELKGLAKIEEANQGDLTFLYLPAYEKYFPQTKASAILVKPGFNKTRDDITYIEVDDPNKAFFKILIHFFYPKFPLEGIDTTASIHPSAKIGKDTAIGKNVVISANCIVGDNVKIFHNTVLLENAEVGDGSIIFQNVSIREDCKVGKRVIIHPGTVIGSDGFGFFKDENGWFQKIPQIGNVIIEDDVELGANVCVDRASLGSTVIKKNVKLDNMVQVAHNVTIGENSVISSQTGLSGSAHIGKNCMIAGQVGIVGHIDIADNVVLIAQSGVSKGIPKAGTYFGSPAKEFRHALKLEAHIRSLPEYADKIKELEEEIKKLKEQVNK
ncbi:MAG TPA: UDP-3-O-(3-hydroxymyristoyl)glucosamine N-acyltransferase [Ignavibacteriaceae bacterium]|nr:UDP-3-O-(3-hydroxymyristoyl)glucosamine N-acyltransferase [Ignavibacteriaceae bacterium]